MLSSFIENKSRICFLLSLSWFLFYKQELGWDFYYFIFSFQSFFHYLSKSKNSIILEICSLFFIGYRFLFIYFCFISYAILNFWRFLRFHAGGLSFDEDVPWLRAVFHLHLYSSLFIIIFFLCVSYFLFLFSYYLLVNHLSIIFIFVKLAS